MKKLLLVLFIIAFAFGVAGTAGALTLVTNRATLGGTDFLDWGGLGSTGTVVPQPLSIVSNGGVFVGVSKTLSGDFQRLDQSAGWSGNFAPGTTICSTLITILVAVLT